MPPRTLSDCVMQVLRQCVARLKAPEEVVAVCYFSFGEFVVALDEQGELLDDIRMYFVNSESEDFNLLVETIGARTIIDTCRILPDNCQ